MLTKMIFLIIFGLTSVKLGKEFQLKKVGAHEGIGLTIGVPSACKWAPMLSQVDAQSVFERFTKWVK